MCCKDYQYTHKTAEILILHGMVLPAIKQSVWTD